MVEVGTKAHMINLIDMINPGEDQNQEEELLNVITVISQDI